MNSHKHQNIDHTKRNDFDRTSSFYKYRREFRGELRFDGVEFHAFVGNMLRVTTWNGYTYLVDRWGGVWRPALEKRVTWDGDIVERPTIEGADLRVRLGSGRSSYRDGLITVRDWSAKFGIGRNSTVL